MFALATDAGILVVTQDGETAESGLENSKVRSVAPVGDRIAVAADGVGVLIGSGDSWEEAGLDGQTIWTLTSLGNLLFAGLEPAAILRREPSGTWTELTALSLVDGYGEWHSPWGPPDLCSIVAEPGRLIVGVEVGGVAVSLDDGLNWKAVNNGLFEDVHAVAAAGETLFAATGGGLHCSRDSGENWTWEADGIDRGYTQGLAITEGHVLVSSASGPPPMWEAGGPEAAIFRASLRSEALAFEKVSEGFEGNIGRQGFAASGDLVVAGTSAGEFLVSTDSGKSFATVASALPAINAVAIL